MAALVPDHTLLIQLGLFFACWATLHYLVFKPYLALQHERHQKTVGLKEKAAQDRERATQLQSEYEAFMKAERKKISAWTDEERKKISEEEHHIIQEARNAVSQDFTQLRAKIEADSSRAWAELLPQVREYSSQIVSRLVGYKVSIPPSPHDGKKQADAESTVVS